MANFELLKEKIDNSLEVRDFIKANDIAFKEEKLNAVLALIKQIK